MYDVIIRGGTIVDGTGATGYRADLAVEGDRIAAIGDLGTMEAACTIDAGGLVITPGFIDSHAHSDTCFMQDSSCASKIFQGITTEVSGQCGSSPFPKPLGSVDSSRFATFEELIGALEQSDGMAVNQAILTGHGSLRAAVIGYADRSVTQSELDRMKQILRHELDAGVWGMSLGLEYSPGFFADPNELQELARVVKEYDGLVPCHMRSEGDHIDEAIDELVNIGKESGAHVHVSHLKLDRYHVHGRAPQVWKRICDARSNGVNITADMYPFTASCTSLSIRCPKWSREGGNDALVRRLCGIEREEIVREIRNHYFNAERAETCLFNHDGGYWPEIVGKTLRDVAEMYLQTNDYADAAAEILIRTKGEAECIFFVMSEKDMLYFLKQDIGIGSDGWAMSADPALVPGKPHPRSYATIPEFFRLVREHQICSLEEAVRRVTSKPADMIGLNDRGRLAVGSIADITVFDPDGIAPRSTYLDPIQTAVGVKYVLVGGKISIAQGKQTEVRNGHFLRKQKQQK